jgi:DNA repair protein RecN (Recombination protein N)
LLEYQVRELESELLPADAFAALEAEHRVLARGGEVLGALEYAAEVLDAESAGAGPALYRAADRLDRHGALDPEIATAAGLLREGAIICGEALNSVQAALSRLDLSPERLQRVELQLSGQHDLARKHRVEPEELPRVLEQLRSRLERVLERLRSRLERSGTLEARLLEIGRERAQALADYREAAHALHQRRVERAAALSATVTGLLQQLGMAGGRFEIEVQLEAERPPAARGSDRVELLVSANPGLPPGSLRKVASGGELSRISLAIKVASRAVAAATQVFDEVDAGIGGETAHAVGALLRSLAANSQALCVTHLAQVAVFAEQQIQVLKSAEGDTTRVRSSLLGERERVDEIARMLGGRLSAQSRAHASELLATASTQH